MRQVADKAASERIACASGVKNFFEREGGNVKNLVAVEKQCAMFAFFDDERARSHIADNAGGISEM